MIKMSVTIITIKLTLISYKFVTSMSFLKFFSELNHKASPLLFIMEPTARARLRDNNDNMFKSQEHWAFNEI